jgi:hypothetical protein
MNREPLIVLPRMLPRHWARADVAPWCRMSPRPEARIGEIWSCDSANRGNESEHLAALIRANPDTMLGDLGRAPPSVRLVLADGVTDNFETRLSFWTILSAAPGANATIRDAHGKIERLVCDEDDVLRVEDGAIQFEGEVTAIELRPNFLPRNEPPGATCSQLSPEHSRSGRETLLRDSALSTEIWTLPPHSWIYPDGETCHVLTALTDGARIDGVLLDQGQSVAVPACGRKAHLSGVGAKLLVTYPDIVPTTIWRHRPTDPAAIAFPRQGSTTAATDSLAA